MHLENAIFAGIDRIFIAALSSCSAEELAEACLAVAMEITQSAYGVLDSHLDGIEREVGGHPSSSFLSMPLLENGQVIGRLAVGNRDSEYGMQQRVALKVLADATAVALQRRRETDELRKDYEICRTS